MDTSAIAASRLPGSRSVSSLSLSIASAALCLAACLQSEPGDDPGGGPDVDMPVDDGRTAGATSSTNWPAELVNDKYLATWSADSTLRIRFLYTPPVFPPVQHPLSLEGTVHLYPGGIIPSLDSVHRSSWSFEATDTLRIPFDRIPIPASATEDTVSFNIQLDMDSLHGMIYGMRYSRRSGRFLSPGDSDKTANSIYLDSLKYYFRGATFPVTSLLPEPAGEKPRISFYIPGTPMYCHAQSDSFHVGPLPKGRYPLRIIRLDGSGEPGAETTLEAWELRVENLGATSTFSLGERVLSYRTRGTLDLRTGK